MPALPADAVMEVEGEMSVFVPVEGEPNTFARRAVRVGERVGDFYPVMDGVSVGDEVVVAGTFILKADLGKAGASHDH
jgi:cobalt-zinc-cadmium efflux system membrane fusion protein